jgi:hypothetical protein
MNIPRVMIIGKEYSISYKEGPEYSHYVGIGTLVSFKPDGLFQFKLHGKAESRYADFAIQDLVFDDVLDFNPDKPNLLKHIRVYLVGGMESLADCGASWRNEIKEKLKDVNIRWFDPVNKVFVKDVQEAGQHQKDLKTLRAEGKFDELAERMKEIRSYDLSMVDRSDAIIFYFDINTFTCGSWEELATANRAKKPIFFICKQGVNNVPLWMFGMIPHKYFYNSIDEVVEIVKSIDSGEKKADSSRWRLLQQQYR